MPDVVVTVPKTLWAAWLGEGDCAGEPMTGAEYGFTVPKVPSIQPGELVYIVAHGKLRGYAPLVRKEIRRGPSGRMQTVLVRRGRAVAVTIPEAIPGFRGFRYRWWRREDEAPFPEWRTP